MSSLPDREPECAKKDDPIVSLVLDGRPRDLGGFTVRRLLPSAERRLVGPFIFFDHMGPSELEPGHGIDVRPHPHIALATVTYLFEGEIMHRDSLGSAQPIRPGAVNWMMAGRGIVHSERTPPAVRARGGALDGIQAWVALPTAREADAPRFEHHDAAAIPEVVRDGARLRVLAGTAFGATSPVGVASPTLYVDARLAAGATLALPDEHEERAVYVADGEVRLDGQRFGGGQMLVLRRGVPVTVTAQSAARIMLLGGAPLDGERHIFWNFVASSAARIEEAKADWRAGRFPKVPGDDKEFIPLPE
ncbi:MAG TPA: pirin family protein [Polyangia bacterium]|nr:pirin family protein [Polyangia bacterium]